MKARTKKAKSRANGSTPSRRELLAAHERSIRATDQMAAQEGFEALVRAGIVTRAGVLTKRYGGTGKDQPWFPESASVGRKNSRRHE